MQLRRPVSFFLIAGLTLIALRSGAGAADKPPLAPDTVAPFSTQSRVSATIEFSLPTLAAEIEREIPRRLATIDEQVRCVHRRVLFFHINANCDIWGHVDRTSSVSIVGRGDRVYGSTSIFGVVEGQGANRFTQRIHGDTEASAVIEVKSRPTLTRDWAVDLNFSDGFHWSQPPVLHVLGRDIPIARYAEPRVRAALAKVRWRAAAAARRLDLRDKAARAWRAAYEPIELSEDPQVWLQLTPQTAAFAGVGAGPQALWGSLEFSGSMQTFVGARPPDLAPAPFPALGHDVAGPGSFDVILPVRIGYDFIKEKIAQALAGESAVKEVQVYPSAGKLIVGLRIAKAPDAQPQQAPPQPVQSQDKKPTNADEWLFLSASIDVNADSRKFTLANLDGIDHGLADAIAPFLGELKDKITVDYGQDYQRLLDAATKKLNRPLKDGFRMEGQVASGKIEGTYLPADGVVIAIRATGALKILYGL